jgi:MFS transporter, DHA1 family, multidrug resistance protein
MVGGFLFVHVNWHAIFAFLGLIGLALWIANWRLLPETLHASVRQPFQVKPLLRGYWELGSSPRFFALALASGVPFNGMFLYVLSAPVFLGELLQLQPQQFFWFFCLTISGIMGGAWLSGRLAGRIKPKHQIRHGFVIMLAVSFVNIALNLLLPPSPWWALPPIAIFAFGWALMVPVVTLMVLDLAPDRRGMASSLQACVGSVANGFVAGVIAPLVMHSTLSLAVASLLMMSIGVFAWLWVKPRVAK